MFREWLCLDLFIKFGQSTLGCASTAHLGPRVTIFPGLFARVIASFTVATYVFAEENFVGGERTCHAAFVCIFCVLATRKHRRACVFGKTPRLSVVSLLVWLKRRSTMHLCVSAPASVSRFGSFGARTAAFRSTFANAWMGSYRVLVAAVLDLPSTNSTT